MELPMNFYHSCLYSMNAKIHGRFIPNNFQFWIKNKKSRKNVFITNETSGLLSTFFNN